MRLIACALLLLASPAFAYDTIANWKTSRIDAQLSAYDTTDQQGFSQTAQLHDLAWKGTRVLNALHRMYELTEGSGYIADLDRNIGNMEAAAVDDTGAHDGDDDGYLGWAVTEECDPEDLSDCSLEDYTHGAEEKFFLYGLIIKEWAKFILTVRKDTALDTTYGTHADALEAMINDELLARWDDWWSEQYGRYLDNNELGETEPVNRDQAMVHALYLMAQVSPDRPHYRLWADRMSQQFHDLLQAEGNGYKWIDRDRVTPADLNEPAPGWEDSQHMNLATIAGYVSYVNGGPFTSTDINAFGSTIKDMWNASTSNPMLSHLVDGSGTSTCSDELQLEHGDFGRWQPDIWELYETARRLDWDGTPTCDTSTWLNVLSAATLLAQHPSQPSPDSFSLAAPTNGATNQNAVVSLQWLPSVNASHYTLQVSTGSSFPSYVINRSKVIGTNAIVRGLSYGTTYYWRVSAKNHDASLSTLSTTFSFTTKSAPTYTLTFCHRDSRGVDATKLGRHFKQVLINNVVIWEQDLFADGSSWTNESINITSNVGSAESVRVRLRLLEKSAVSNNGVDADFDNISITNADVLNGDFEAGRLGSTTEPRFWWWDQAGSVFTGSTIAAACNGSRSYRISLPVSTPTQVGNFGAVEQMWAVKR